MRNGWHPIVGMILFLAFVASWFAWGPTGLFCYVDGRFNSLHMFFLDPLVLLLIPAVLTWMILQRLFHWRELGLRQKYFSMVLWAALGAFVISFGLGFARIIPTPYDVFVRGFARYAERHADVTAIQNWLGTLDSNKYADGSPDPSGIPVPDAEQPPAIARLHPHRYPHGVRVIRDDTGKLMVRLMWGGGFIGHWGVEIDDKGMTPRPNSEFLGYIPLAPSNRVWYELD